MGDVISTTGEDPIPAASRTADPAGSSLAQATPFIRNDLTAKPFGAKRAHGAIVGNLTCSWGFDGTNDATAGSGTQMTGKPPSDRQKAANPAKSADEHFVTLVFTDEQIAYLEERSRLANLVRPNPTGRRFEPASSPRELAQRLTWTALPVPSCTVECERPFSFYFGLIEAYWKTAPSDENPLHRLSTLARKQGAKAMVFEDASQITAVADEIATLDAKLGGGGAAEAILLSFLSEVPNGDDIATVSDKALIGQCTNHQLPPARHRRIQANVRL